MAELLGEETVLIDPGGGPAAVASSLAVVIEALGVDLTVFCDVGGDALAGGDEPGLASPLCDAVMVAAAGRLAGAGHPVLGAVFGPGCDGELTFAETMARFSLVAAAGGLAGVRGLTPAVVDRLEAAVAAVPTEASAQPLRAFRGETGVASIRRGERSVELTPAAAVTIFYDVTIALAAAAPLARAVDAAKSLEQANDALHTLGVRSELDLERARAQESAA